MRKQIRIVIADDVEMMLRGLEVFAQSKGIKVAGTAKNGKDLVAIVDRVKPDVVITDIQMPVMDGIEATSEIKKKHPEIPVIGITQFDDNPRIVEMLKAGARGYLLKFSGMDSLFEAIDAVLEGSIYYCEKTSLLLSKMISTEIEDEKKILFNEKEIAIIRLTCHDKISKEIASKINLSKNTIDKYRRVIMDKLGVNGTAGIVIWAMKNGVYEENDE